MVGASSLGRAAPALVPLPKLTCEREEATGVNLSHGMLTSVSLRPSSRRRGPKRSAQLRGNGC